MSDRLRAPSSEAAARRQAFFAGWAFIAVFILLQDTVNALSQIRDRPNSDPREPFVWEFTSGAMIICLAPFIIWMVRTFPPRPGRWARFIAGHLTGSVAFSLAHVAGSTLLRWALYAMSGAHRHGPDWLYEYRKDAVAYVGFAGLVWLLDWAFRLWSRSRTFDAAPGQRVYHLKEGSRVARVPIEEIVAVASARNYVEFHLANGRKPLVRETLAKVEKDLAGAGFLRTHRSWIVNPLHVRLVAPGAAGDYRLEFDTGLTAPLSRRFPAALESLRSQGSGPAIPLQ